MTQTISSLLSRWILRRASESASLGQQTQDTYQKKNKKKSKKKSKTKKAGTLSTPSHRCSYPSTTSLADNSANADQTDVFGILRGSTASNSSHDDVDPEADEYLRFVFNVPEARLPPLIGWSDYEADETLGCRPPVEELDSWVFPSVPFEPFFHRKKHTSNCVITQSDIIQHT